MQPRQRIPPLPPPRAFENIGDIDRAIAKLRRRVQDVERLAAEHVSHGDAAVRNVEHAIRDTIREEFGEGSTQYHRHNNFKIDDGPMYAMGFNESAAHFDARGQQQFQQRIPGAITRLEGLIEQLEERRADLAQLERATTVDERSLDPLVALRTRGVLEREFATYATEPDVPLCLVLFDIDHFKSVNDDHGGHAIGDEALVSLARVAEACVKGKGGAFRFGGDEFVLLLPNHSLQEGLAVAERFRRAVEASPRTSRQLTLTVSIGVAEWPVHGGSFDSLYKAADAALYDAKKRGRNLVRYHGEPEPTAVAPREPERREPVAGELTLDEQRKIRERVLQDPRRTLPKGSGDPRRRGRNLDGAVEK
jgi:diguanylate cyclase (GGDEF)-like protein